jgi:hypothetical protein
LGVDVCEALESGLVFLFKEKVVGSGGCVVFVGEKAFTCEIGVVSEFGCFCEDVVVDGDGVFAYYNAQGGGMVVQPVELLTANLWQAETFVAGGQQAFEDLFGEGGDFVRDFVVEG